MPCSQMKDGKRGVLWSHKKPREAGLIDLTDVREVVRRRSVPAHAALRLQPPADVGDGPATGLRHRLHVPRGAQDSPSFEHGVLLSRGQDGKSGVLEDRYEHPLPTRHLSAASYPSATPEPFVYLATGTWFPSHTTRQRSAEDPAAPLVATLSEGARGSRGSLPASGCGRERGRPGWPWRPWGASEQAVHNLFISSHK